jgi:hypothetical protein
MIVEDGWKCKVLITRFFWLDLFSDFHCKEIKKMLGIYFLNVNLILSHKKSSLSYEQRAFITMNYVIY